MSRHDANTPRAHAESAGKFSGRELVRRGRKERGQEAPRVNQTAILLATQAANRQPGVCLANLEDHQASVEQTPEQLPNEQPAGSTRLARSRRQIMAAFNDSTEFICAMRGGGRNLSRTRALAGKLLQTGEAFPTAMRCRGKPQACQRQHHQDRFPVAHCRSSLSEALGSSNIFANSLAFRGQ